MKNKTLLVSGALCLAISPTALYANPVVENAISVFAKTGYDSTHVTDADFDGFFSVEAGARWQLQDGFSLEVALGGINEAETDVEEDNTGTYQLTLNSLDLMAGGQYKIQFAPKFSGYVRAGVLAYSMEIELEEGFYGLKPSGKDSAEDNGFGYYGGVGAAFEFNPQWALIGEMLYKTRLDFLSSSSQPLDVDTFGIAVGMAHSF